MGTATVLVLNNYSFTRVRNEINDGLKPLHHLYGIDALERAGYRLLIIDPIRNGFWYKLGTFLNKVPLLYVGELAIQIEALKRRKEYQVVYAPCQNVTVLLGVLSFLGLFNKKIIALAHHPLFRGRLAGIRKYSLFFSVKGHNCFAALSTPVVQQLKIVSAKTKSGVLHWGPQLSYYDEVLAKLTNVPKDIDILALGRTGRDYATLVKAFTGTTIRVAIYCTKDQAAIMPASYSSNINIRHLTDAEALDYPSIIALYQRAHLLAVPMFAQDSLCGLTSVTDAMALGMALLITRNSYIEIDVEENGFGYWIEAGDAIAWRNTTTALLNDAARIKKMGAAARIAGNTLFNIDLFAKELLEIFHAV